MRFVVVGALVLAFSAMSCDGGATQYEVTVQFNTSATQDNLDEVGELLRSYDDDLEFVIMEIFPPIGRATLETDAADFCSTIEAELEGKTYVRDATCERR